MKTGNIVTIKEEWEGEGDLYRIVEWNGDRGLISPVEWDGGIVPTELVREEMIDLVA